MGTDDPSQLEPVERGGLPPAPAGRGRQWPLRLVGSLFGIGAGLFGLFSLLGMGEQPELNRERAIGFGIVALVVGAVALIGSLTARNVHALWYCSRRRWRIFRDDVGPRGARRTRWRSSSP